MLNPKSLVISVIKDFLGNPHDSKTIEPVIGYLKQYFRMEQNYLQGPKLPQINTFLAATEWNLKNMMQKLKEELKNILLRFILNQYILFLNQQIYNS